MECELPLDLGTTDSHGTDVKRLRNTALNIMFFKLKFSVQLLKHIIS